MSNKRYETTIPNYFIESRQKIREELEELTKKFLANGGKINDVTIVDPNAKQFKPASHHGKNTSESEDY